MGDRPEMTFPGAAVKAVAAEARARRERRLVKRVMVASNAFVCLIVLMDLRRECDGGE